MKDSNTKDFNKMKLLKKNFNADATIKKVQKLAFITLLNKGKESSAYHMKETIQNYKPII